MFLTIKQNLSTKSSLQQTAFMQAYIQKKLQTMTQLQSQLTRLKAKNRYNSQKQPIYQTFTPT